MDPQLTAAGVALAAIVPLTTRPSDAVAVSVQVPSVPAAPVTRPDAQSDCPSAPKLTMVTVA